MITPIEKAKQLYDKCFARYCDELSHYKNHSKAKAIALDMVKEILEFGNNWDYSNDNGRQRHH